jgi:hypothetical protein
MEQKGTISMKLGIPILALPTLLLFQPAQAGSILGQLPTSSERIVSTVPTNGDVNPYGVAFVPDFFFPAFQPNGGPLEPGDILVSNFNNSSNAQGTGTTIVRISRQGQLSVFFQGNPGLGLTTALGVLQTGFVLVGNLPASSSGSIEPTSLLVINRHGKLVATLSDPKLLAGPWDLTVIDQGATAEIFVSNVLSGTVTRLNVSMDFDGDKFNVNSKTQIASGYAFRTDPNALVVGPTGLAYDPLLDVMYVASAGDNKIFAIPHPRNTQDNGTGKVIYQDNTHLHGPLGLVLAPNGHLITANGDAQNAGGNPNELVEFTREGQFVAQFQVDPGGPGGAFGIAISFGLEGLRFAAVDDDANTLEIWTIGFPFGF